MTKFHINKNGIPAPCKAKPGNCPLGGDENHFDNIKDAEVYADNENMREHGLLPEVSSSGSDNLENYNEEAISELIDIVNNSHGVGDIDEMARLVGEKFDLKKKGVVYSNEDFSIRFSKVGKDTGGFPNTVLSLSSLMEHDDKPVIVCEVRPSTNRLHLANTTLIKKLSHSSPNLRVDNIRGSFNGNNISSKLGELDNKPANFKEMFREHGKLGFDGNIERIIEETNGIRGYKERFVPNESQLDSIMNSASRSKDFIDSDNYKDLYKELDDQVQLHKEALIEASKIENENLRGQRVEDIINEIERDDQGKPITKNGKPITKEQLDENDLSDYYKEFDNLEVSVDIKSKLLYKNGNPKGYNVDKFLEHASIDKSISMAYVVAFDEKDNVHTKLVSVFDENLVDKMHTTSLLSGINTRGTTLYNGDSIKNLISEPNRKSSVNLNESKKLIKKLLNM